MGGGGEGTIIADCIGQGVFCLKEEPVSNGFETRIENGCGDGGSGSVEGFRTYKRRKHSRSSSESKGQKNGRISAETGSRSANETAKEPPDCPTQNHTSLDVPNDVSHKQWRNFFLERIFESLNHQKGGIQGCIQDALKMADKETDSCDKDEHKCCSQSGGMPNGTDHAATGPVDLTSKESLDEPCRPVTEMCRQILVNILLSENFTSLCKLLCENFQEVKADNLLSLINIRMKDGVYERSPFLFCTDIQRVWRKFRGIGFGLMSLGKNLADVSLNCFNEQFCNPESYFDGKLEKFCTCRHCGGKADGRDCLVCDSCEEMYHISCIQPAVKEISLKSWYCANCITVGMGSPHENCVVCKRLNAPRDLCNEAEVEMKYTMASIERTSSKSDGTSNCDRDDLCQPSVGCKSACVCKICGSEVENGEKVKICEHNGCPYKYYHVRCLTANMLKSHGPRWYCPSCLCIVCLHDRDDHKIILCDGCDQAFHLYCLNPPRSSVPRGKWFCMRCDVKMKKMRRALKAYEKQGNNRMKMKDEMGKSALGNLGKQLDEKFD